MRSNRVDLRRNRVDLSLPASTEDDTWVSSAPFRAHVHRLMDLSGLPWRAIAMHACVPERVVQRLVGPPRRGGRIVRAYAARLFAITPQELRRLGRTWQAAEPTSELIRALVSSGWTVDGLADALRLSNLEIGDLAMGRQQNVTYRCALMVRAAAQAHGLLVDPDAEADACKPDALAA